MKFIIYVFVLSLIGQAPLYSLAVWRKSLEIELFVPRKPQKFVNVQEDIQNLQKTLPIAESALKQYLQESQWALAHQLLSTLREQIVMDALAFSEISKRLGTRLENQLNTQWNKLHACSLQLNELMDIYYKGFQEHVMQTFQKNQSQIVKARNDGACAFNAWFLALLDVHTQGLLAEGSNGPAEVNALFNGQTSSLKVLAQKLRSNDNLSEQQREAAPVLRSYAVELMGSDPGFKNSYIEYEHPLSDIEQLLGFGNRQDQEAFRNYLKTKIQRLYTRYLSFKRSREENFVQVDEYLPLLAYPYYWASKHELAYLSDAYGLNTWLIVPGEQGAYATEAVLGEKRTFQHKFKDKDMIFLQSLRDYAQNPLVILHNSNRNHWDYVPSEPLAKELKEVSEGNSAFDSNALSFPLEIQGETNTVVVDPQLQTLLGIAETGSLRVAQVFSAFYLGRSTVPMGFNDALNLLYRIEVLRAEDSALPESEAFWRSLCSENWSSFNIYAVIKALNVLRKSFHEQYAQVQNSLLVRNQLVKVAGALQLIENLADIENTSQLDDGHKESLMPTLNELFSENGEDVAMQILDAENMSVQPSVEELDRDLRRRQRLVTSLAHDLKYKKRKSRSKVTFGELRSLLPSSQRKRTAYVYDYDHPQESKIPILSKKHVLGLFPKAQIRFGKKSKNEELVMSQEFYEFIEEKLAGHRYDRPRIRFVLEQGLYEHALIKNTPALQKLPIESQKAWAIAESLRKNFVQAHETPGVCSVMSRFADDVASFWQLWKEQKKTVGSERGEQALHNRIQAFKAAQEAELWSETQEIPFNGWSRKDLSPKMTAFLSTLMDTYQATDLAA